MKTLVLLILIGVGGWFFFQAQNKVADWRTDVDKKRDQLVDCSEEWNAIYQLSGQSISFLAAFDRLKVLNEKYISENEQLIKLLQNKPYGLELSVDERERLTRAISDRGTLEASRTRLEESEKKERERIQNNGVRH